jgi:DNA-binding transcriptional regulator YiaG
MTTKNDLFHYVQCGLDNVWLTSGVEVTETDYGKGFRISKAEELHEAIARSIINGPRHLRGQEARFLRVLLNLSQDAMAKILGVDRATVIRWERARERPLTMIQDIAVRTTYAARATGDDFLLSVIKEMQDTDEKAYSDLPRQVFETSNQGWRVRQAA